MKRYVPIIIGIVALCAAVYAGTVIIKNRNDVKKEEETSLVSSKSFSGKVVRMFEGENVLEYNLDIPEGATTTVEKDGSLIKVLDQDTLLLAMYISYEGGRGYSPADYINDIIIKSVPTASIKGTTTIGSYDWDVVESERSIWHVAKGGDGNWLLVVENKKADMEKANTILESIKTN